jgi:hypothetical protein
MKLSIVRNIILPRYVCDANSEVLACFVFKLEIVFAVQLPSVSFLIIFLIQVVLPVFMPM